MADLKHTVKTVNVKTGKKKQPENKIIQPRSYSNTFTNCLAWGKSYEF